MQNVDIKINGKLMVITVDLSKSQGRSKSGKSEIIATTAGNIHVNDVTIGLNVYRRK